MEKCRECRFIEKLENIQKTLNALAGDTRMLDRIDGAPVNISDGLRLRLFDIHDHAEELSQLVWKTLGYQDIPCTCPPKYSNNVIDITGIKP